jgi:Putative DNA-binding domain
MPALRELQAAFCAALIGGDDAAVAALIRDDGLPPSVRLDIYRNNVLASLKQVLIDTFPVVCELVDERFFLYAAHEFIRRHPPDQACLFAYGARFADFLATFQPCRHLVYLPDVARLEWLMNLAAHAENATPLPPSALASVAAHDTPNLILQLDPSLGLLESAWPVDRIWHANQPGAGPDISVDLDAGGARIEVRRVGEKVVLRLLDPATYALRAALDAGRRLEEAAELALTASPALDLATALQDLFADGSVVGFSVVCQREGRPCDGRKRRARAA